MAHDEEAGGVILFGSEKGRLRTSLTVVPTYNWFMMGRPSPGIRVWSCGEVSILVILKTH